MEQFAVFRAFLCFFIPLPLQKTKILPLYAAMVPFFFFFFLAVVVILNRRTCEMRLHKRWTCFIYGILPVLQIYVPRLWSEPKEER